MSRGKAARDGGALNAELPLWWRIRATAAALIIPPLLEVMSFSKIERALAITGRACAPAPDDRAAARFVNELLWRLPDPWKCTCLRRSSVLYYLLAGGARPVELCIGVRRNEMGELLAHAWLLRDGVPYLEPRDNAEQAASFRQIARFPQRATAGS